MDQLKTEKVFMDFIQRVTMISEIL